MATLTVGISNSAIVSGNKAYTVSDSDLQLLLNWAAKNYKGSLSVSPTNQQILLAWFQSWIKSTIDQVQSSGVIVPAPITIA